MGTHRAMPVRSNASEQFARWWLPTVCLLPTLLVGCSGGNARRMEADLYQRELRLQEDEIYRLEDYLEEYQAIVRGYRCEVAELREELKERGAARTKPPEAIPEVVSPQPFSAPAEAQPAPAPDDLIEMPATEEAPAFKPAPETDAGEAPAFEPAPLFQPAAEPLPAPNAGASRDRPTVTLAAGVADRRDTPPLPYAHISATPIADAEPADAVVVPSAPIRLEVRREAAGQGGAETLTAIVTELEERSLTGFRGEASLMLTDPAANGKQRRLARWDFSPAEVESAWTVPPEVAPQLELPISLPASGAFRPNARLWVRLVDESGAKMLQATPLETVAPPNQRAAASPTRLPDVEAPIDRSDAIALNADLDATGWRRAVRGRRPRRLDPAVTAAAHFIEPDASAVVEE